MSEINDKKILEEFNIYYDEDFDFGDYYDELDPNLMLEVSHEEKAFNVICQYDDNSNNASCLNESCNSFYESGLSSYVKELIENKGLSEDFEQKMIDTIDGYINSVMSTKTIKDRITELTDLEVKYVINDNFCAGISDLSLNTYQDEESEKIIVIVEDMMISRANFAILGLVVFENKKEYYDKFYNFIQDKYVEPKMANDAQLANDAMKFIMRNSIPLGLATDGEYEDEDEDEDDYEDKVE
jgi:hypothetical protein